jgi:hypothetical protein
VELAIVGPATLGWGIACRRRCATGCNLCRCCVPVPRRRSATRHAPMQPEVACHPLLQVTGRLRPGRVRRWPPARRIGAPCHQVPAQPLGQSVPPPPIGVAEQATGSVIERKQCALAPVQARLVPPQLGLSDLACWPSPPPCRCSVAPRGEVQS